MNVLRSAQRKVQHAGADGGVGDAIDQNEATQIVVLAERLEHHRLAKLDAADANLVGLGMELDAIAAVAVGGTLLTGGRATVVGTLLGALIIQLVRYTLLANGVPDARVGSSPSRATR